MPTSDSPKHGKPYVWVSWITGLLAGTDRCEWAAWYKAHFRYAKLDRAAEDPEALDRWKEDHTAMVNARADRIRREDRYPLVFVEEENKFALKGESVILGGKPDIVGLEGVPDSLRQRDGIVIDQKSGAKSSAHVWQVRVYMFAAAYLEWQRAYRFVGEVEYRGSTIAVDPLNAEEKARIIATLRTVGSDLEPPRTPRAEECERCDIAVCPDRIVVQTQEATTKDF
jgi:PD-(D/E)XK nuclease superfamily